MSRAEAEQRAKLLFLKAKYERKQGRVLSAQRYEAEARDLLESVSRET